MDGFILYTGVTGVMTQEEVEKILKLGHARSKVLAIGILVSAKTMRGISTKYDFKFPPLSEISKLYVWHPNVLYIIHYCIGTIDGQEMLNQDLNRLLNDLLILTAMFPWIGGFQINGTCSVSDAELLKEYRSRHPEKRIILQVGRKFFSKNYEEIYDKLDLYWEGISDILLDLSGGEGNDKGLADVFNFAKNLHRRQNELSPGKHKGIGVSGGLDGKTLESIRGLFEVWPQTNTDAEGKLRTEDKTTFDFPKVKDYIEVSDSLLR